MTRTFLLCLVAATLFVPAVLLSDGAGIVRQLMLASVTIAFVVLLAKRAGVGRGHVLCAILIATIGECVLSIGWGLYTYRFAMLPLYVPAGHGLFYTLAAYTADQETLRRRTKAITGLVIIAGSVVAAITLMTANDVWGLIWWVAAAAIISRSRNALLLSVCCLYTMLLEWTGTAFGNWHWSAIVPGLGLHCANPPSGVGILYVLLDVTTVAVTSYATTLATPSTLPLRARSESVPSGPSSPPAAAPCPP